MRLRVKHNEYKDDVLKQALEKKAIAKLYWGIFSFESYVSDHCFAVNAARSVLDFIAVLHLKHFGSCR